MLSAIIVASDRRLVSYVSQVCAEFPDIFVNKTIDLTAGGYVIAQALNSHAPDVLFLEIAGDDGWDAAGTLSALGDLLLLHRETAVIPIAWSREEGPPILLAGEELPPPLTPRFSAEDLEQAVVQAMQRKRRQARSSVVAVLPAKPGAGATTVALNVAGSLANRLTTSTLLVEADRNSGPIPLMLDLFATQYIASSIENPQMLTDAGWEQAVTHSHGLDILTTSGAPQAGRGSRWDYYRLLKFARERYEFVVVDLPDLVDEVAEAVITEADKTYLVCTAEVPSLHMVRRRMWDLETAGVRHGHVNVLVNRRAPDDPPAEALESIVQREIAAVLPEDRAGVRNALGRRGLLDAENGLGRALLGLAADLRGVKVPRSAAERSRADAPRMPGLRRLMNAALGRQ